MIPFREPVSGDESDQKLSPPEETRNDLEDVNAIFPEISVTGMDERLSVDISLPEPPTPAYDSSPIPTSNPLGCETISLSPEEMKQVLEQQFPGMTIEFSDDPLPEEARRDLGLDPPTGADDVADDDSVDG